MTNRTFHGSVEPGLSDGMVVSLDKNVPKLIQKILMRSKNFTIHPIRFQNDYRLVILDDSSIFSDLLLLEKKARWQ